MNSESLEKGLIEYCAPTLAGIKCACLFNYFCEDRQNIKKELAEINALLNEKGLYVEVLAWRQKSALVYAYRTALLDNELRKAGVYELLKNYGYENCEREHCINYLKKRIADCDCFPHEIGIFLGYPLEDVQGFIENGGKNCESCGIWKVYCNKEEKDKLFCKLKKCTDVYHRVFCEGRKLVQMTVCT